MTTGNLCALPFLEQDETPAFPLLKPAIDLRPEGLEIVDRGPDRKQYHEIERNPADTVKNGILAPQDQECDRRHLRDHLDLAFLRRVNREPLRGSNAP